MPCLERFNESDTETVNHKKDIQMTEKILAIGAVLLLLNVIFIHGYFFFKAKLRLEGEINSLPNDAEAVIQKRSAELKNVRKNGKKISFELAASKVKKYKALLQDILLLHLGAGGPVFCLAAFGLT